GHLRDGGRGGAGAGRGGRRADPRRVRGARHRGQGRRRLVRPAPADPRPGAVPRAAVHGDRGGPGAGRAGRRELRRVRPGDPPPGHRHHGRPGGRGRGGAGHGRHDAARLLPGGAGPRVAGGRGGRRHAGRRAAPAPVRGEQRLPGAVGAGRAGVLRHLAGPAAGGVRRAAPGRPPVLPGYAGAPGAEVPADPAAPAVPGVHPGGGGVLGGRPAAGPTARRGAAADATPERPARQRPAVRMSTPHENVPGLHPADNTPDAPRFRGDSAPDRADPATDRRGPAADRGEPGLVGAPERAEGPRYPVTRSEQIYRGRVLALRAGSVRMPGGAEAVREVVENLGAVAVVALDAEGRIALIRQYRHPVGRALWELPAGLLDLPGEPADQTARRELFEEAHLAAARWDLLVDLNPSPGFTDEAVRVYLARELSAPDAERYAAEHEEADLEVRRFPLDEAVGMVLGGEITNGIAAAGVLAAARA